MDQIITKAHLTGPKCHAVQDVDMPTDACQHFVVFLLVCRYQVPAKTIGTIMNNKNIIIGIPILLRFASASWRRKSGLDRVDTEKTNCKPEFF